jgi:hypothetical protein
MACLAAAVVATIMAAVAIVALTEQSTEKSAPAALATAVAPMATGFDHHLGRFRRNRMARVTTFLAADTSHRDQ